MSKYVLIAAVSGVISAISQVLLKKSTMQAHSTKVREYLNLYVVSGYGLTLLCMVLMILAYRGLPLKYGAVMEALVYFYVMVLSRVLFREPLSPKCVIGNLLIVLGVIVYSI